MDYIVYLLISFIYNLSFFFRNIIITDLKYENLGIINIAKHNNIIVIIDLDSVVVLQ